jgi:vacuolar-type H+-ATPase subunit F/Vma7
MNGVVAIGEADRVAGYALAGATVRVAESPAAAVEAWLTLDPETELVVLTPAAAKALGPDLDEQDHRIWAVLPE